MTTQHTRIFWITFVLLYQASISMAQTFEIHGHRGARGHLPENTIPSFIRAVELGAHAIELDVVITKDRQVLVSHEPYMSTAICLDSAGNELKNAAKKHNIFEMTYAETQHYDCGSIPHKRFPNQHNQPVQKPLLKDVVAALDSFTREQNLTPIRYNIEIKSDPKGDHWQHPAPQEYVQLVYDEIMALELKERCFVQSFDLRILQELKRLDPEIEISLLIANKKSIAKNIAELGFQPDYYTPYFRLLNKRAVADLHNRGIKVGAWTVNQAKHVDRLIEWGVDVIITDYPELGQP